MHESAILSVPLVLGMVAAVRQATHLPARYLPLCALCMGAALALLFQEASLAALADGLVIGLSASGLYSGTKAVVKG